VLLGADPAGRSAAELCSALAAAVAQPVPLHGLDVRVSASIGTAQAQYGDTLEDLLHRADTAMYAQKSRTDRRASAAAHTGVAAEARPSA
jgi:predicted signal transduction protein with EAL and GGDEF domain